MSKKSNMSSIVLELQKEALSSTGTITDLLRKALFVARKLKVREFEDWIKRELDGYGNVSAEEIPAYRELSGIVKVWNPFHGWQEVMFKSSKQMESLSKRGCSQSISEIEHMLTEHKPGGHFEMSYPAEVAVQLMKAIGHDLRPSLHIPASRLSRILDAVRNLVLNWSMKLEEDGILGSEVTFSKDEVEKAARANYTINNFFGDVVRSQVQQGTTYSAQEMDRK